MKQTQEPARAMACVAQAPRVDTWASISRLMPVGVPTVMFQMYVSKRVIFSISLGLLLQLLVSLFARLSVTCSSRCMTWC